VIADPIIALAVQSVGVVLAVIVGSFVGISASLPAASSIGPSALLELLFTIVFVNGSSGSSLSNGFTYFGCLSTFASSFNPAFSLGAYLAGLAGFGSGSLAVTSIAVPLVGGLAAGFLAGKFSEFNGILGSVFLFLVVGSGVNALALGAMVAAINGSWGETNPAFNFKDVKAVGFQVVGATLGALLANWAGVADGAAVSAGLPGDISGAVAELLLAAFLLKAGYGEFGLNYFALLSVFGATAGSIANPAVALGGFIGGGILGGGFDFGGIIGLVGHIAIPVVAALVGGPLFDIVPGKLMLDKAQLDASEFFGSFLLVTAAAGVAGAGADSTTFAYGIALAFVYAQYPADGIPAISAYNAFGKGADVVGFLKKLVAQTLGALVAAFASNFLVGGDVAGRMLSEGAAAAAAPAPSDSSGLNDTLRNGILLGVFLAWGWVNSKGFFGKVLTYFTAVTLFAGVQFNGAAALGVAVKGAIGGDVGAFTDVAWLAAFFSPIVGGILAGRLGDFFGV
jgi:hypothetical protein